ncbi:hypothetical protein HDV57DRAFT_80456 [Trichoderma longibrachiatum]|uniref:Uncharacterized protein n=1 Tax=Trichoderma longibrachiatum ATCC 18648 TaxID=983965 RepID=A0A2T4BV47_TRILO|nr:hypothetical protein M440DRAFT_143690 [Trichoderma longibrachiatum ATCC 18648]
MMDAESRRWSGHVYMTSDKAVVQLNCRSPSSSRFVAAVVSLSFRVVSCIVVPCVDEKRVAGERNRNQTSGREREGKIWAGWMCDRGDSKRRPRPRPRTQTRAACLALPCLALPCLAPTCFWSWPDPALALAPCWSHSAALFFCFPGV